MSDKMKRETSCRLRERVSLAEQVEVLEGTQVQEFNPTEWSVEQIAQQMQTISKTTELMVQRLGRLEKAQQSKTSLETEGQGRQHRS